MDNEVVERGAMGFDDDEIDEEASTRALKKAAEALGIAPGVRGPSRINWNSEKPPSEVVNPPEKHS